MKTLDFSGKQFFQPVGGFSTGMNAQAQKPSAYTAKPMQWQKK